MTQADKSQERVMIRIQRDDLTVAVTQGVIDAVQADPLWQTLSDAHNARPRFALTSVIYWFGTLLVIGAMALFITTAWTRLDSGTILTITALYTLACAGAGIWLWHRRGLHLPGGLLITVSVCMTSLTAYALQHWFGIWPSHIPGHYTDLHQWVRGGWFWMQVTPLICGLMALRFFKADGLTIPVICAAFVIVMDLTQILFAPESMGLEERRLAAIGFGLVLIIISYAVDRNTQEDISFWGYLLGAFAFWGGLYLMDTSSHYVHFGYFLINLGLIGLSVFLRRRVFVILGACGVVDYLADLAAVIFAGSVLYPLALTAFGMLTLTLGLILHKHANTIEHKLIAILPRPLRTLRPPQR